MIPEQYPKIYLYKRIVQAKIFIDTNYANRIELETISDEAYFSKFHFTRLFKKIYGYTPHQYLTVVRIEKAKELFFTDKTVQEVCFSVGFESLTSFSGLFKRIVGISPSTYFKQQQAIKLQINKTPLAFIPSCFAHQHGWIK